MYKTLKMVLVILQTNMSKEFKIVGITDITIRNILQNGGSEALALYVAYYEISTWQGTYRVRATTGFMAKRMKWSSRKVIRVKNKLKELKVLADYQDKTPEGVIKGHYVAIKHLVDEGVTKTHRVDEPTGWENGIQVLSTGSLSTLNKKEVLSQTVEIKDRFEKIRRTYKTQLKGKTRGFETEFSNASKKHDITMELLERIAKGAKRMYSEKKEQYPDGYFQFVPMFQTFINQSKWEEYEE